MNKRLLALAGVIAALAVGMAAAQEEAASRSLASQDQDRIQPQQHDSTLPSGLALMVVEHVKPGFEAQYEQATKDLIDALASYRVAPEKINFMTIAGPELGYVFVMPLGTFGEMDTLHRNWNEAIGIIGKDRWDDISTRVDETIDTREVLHSRWMEDLSFVPRTPRFAPEEATFISYEFYYVIPGREKAFEASCREYRTMYERKRIDIGWNVFKSVTGSELPLYVISYAAPSESDSLALHGEMRKTLGEPASQLEAEALTNVRRIERKQGWIRPDLSYPKAPDGERMTKERKNARTTR